MFVKITTSGPRKYVKLVEAFRDTRGVPRQRVVATLGRLEQLQGGKSDALLNGLLRTMDTLTDAAETLESVLADLDRHIIPAISVTTAHSHRKVR